MAGKRAGLAGERSGLFMEQIRIVKEMRAADLLRGRTAQSVRPRIMLWENVEGAFSSNNREDFRVVLEEICRIGDRTVSIPGPDGGKWKPAGAIVGDGFSVAWRILDAQYWPQTPQRRRRIYLVGDFGGQSAPQILFEQERLSGNPEAVKGPGKAAAAPAGSGAADTGGD